MDDRHPLPTELPVEDPFLAALEAAPYDDEPYTDEERAAVEEGEAQYRRGEYDTLENVRRRLLGEETGMSQMGDQ